MKIVYLTDIHDSLRGLKEVLIQTDADLYVFSGDIIYKAFFNTDKIIEFSTLQEQMNSIIKSIDRDIMPYDYALEIVRIPSGHNPELVNQAMNYRTLIQQASKTMKEKYQLIEKIIKRYAKSEVKILPGNYDLDLQYTALCDMDIHKKYFEFQDLKFCGYGGAPIDTPGIPENLAVKFHEYNKNGNTYSEPEVFFKENTPEILLIHNPSYGYLDLIPRYGHVGSQGIRRYLDEFEPILVLSGHVHEDGGIIKKRNTIFLNPSNFGSVESVHGEEPGGFFAEIFIENHKVENVSLKKMDFEKYTISNLLDINCKESSLHPSFFGQTNEMDLESFIKN